MKTILQIEVNSPDRFNIWESGKTKESYTEEELNTLQTNFAKEVHKELVEEMEKIEEIFKDRIDDGLLLEDYFLEDWTIDDLNINIEVKK